jgi:hypothetical protein
MSDWLDQANKDMDNVLERLRQGKPVSDSPRLNELAKRIVKYQEENPITDIKAWAKKLAEESVKFND